MDYDLRRLNSRSFEQLVQAIATKVLGPGLIIFGDGPDGGREASINGLVPYPTEQETWEGEVVLQAKFRQRPEGTGPDGDWAVERLRLELKAFEDPDSPRVLPQFLIFATNVVLGPAKDSGAKDRLFAIANESGLEGFDVWDHDKMCVFLDTYEEIRRAFAAYVLSGDVLSSMVDAIESIRSEQPEFDDAMSRFLQKELLSDQWANLEQAGRAADEQVPVSRVFVDLPFSAQRQPDPPEEDTTDSPMEGFVAHVVSAASHRLDRKAQNEQVRGETLDADLPVSEGRFVLLGGPGQGKSTVGQFVCQLFRAALLRTRPVESLSPEVVDALSALESHCGSNALALPTVTRFPLRVELSRFADELGRPDGPNSLLEYLAEMISSRIQDEVPAKLMSTWLAQYPWLLVLDGLDEVPASGNREEVLKAIKEFWVDSSQENSDCLVIATTRPQGYSEEFSPRYYRHLWLTPLSTYRALRYADRLLDTRILDDEERREKIADRLRRAVSRPDTARLMTSPLQVTIMATLLERMGQPPEGRWNLFSQYYRVIYDRELERDIPAASVLRDYKPDIDAIHRRVALMLQVEGESAEQAEAQISRSRFTEVVTARLREEEHDFENDSAIVEQIIDTAMERLVFLVGLEADRVGFEIRSLQEFMAAEALLDGKESIVEQRLRAIAQLPLWRNVFLFAAGRCFTDLQHHRDTIYTICSELNEPDSDPLASVMLPGSDLAIDLLSDGVANRQPRYERLLSREALRILRRPANNLNDQLAELYRPSLKAVYESELKTALASENFLDCLPAWRTLAVLTARKVDWAPTLLRSRLPDVGELDSLLSAVSPVPHSKDVASVLIELCVKSPPHESLPHRDTLERLGVLDLAPMWFRAVLELTKEEEAPPEEGFHFEGAAENELIARVRLLGSMDEHIQRAVEMATSADLDEAPKSWMGLVAALRFAESPSAENLADQLKELANLDDFADLRRVGIYNLWPLASLLVAAKDLPELADFAEAASDGRFGVEEDWLAAEARWKEGGVVAADLFGSQDGTYPFNEAIAEVGFPFGAATIRALDDRNAAARLMLEWLKSANHLPTRQFMTNVFFWLLSGRHSRKSSADSPAIDAVALLDALRSTDLKPGAVINLGAINALTWSDELTDKEIELLERLGGDDRHLSGLAPSSIEADICARIFDAWDKDRSRTGLYRLLAGGWAMEDVSVEDPQQLLASEPDHVTAPAHAVVAIKLGEAPTPEMLTALNRAADPWLDFAITSLHGDPGAEAVNALDTALPAESWEGKLRLVDMARELIGRRPSGLAEDTRWNALELFDRPALPA